mmetsp:Transcript_14074/g.21245  ORF Transcript_14074/g.21245 Transcript_14074/m.21245 type:complete len:436 (+) Transcript_14074:2-1309(+)
MNSQRLRNVLVRLERELKNWEKSERSEMRFAVDSKKCAELCKAIGTPQKRMRCIHIAGSKGKGSVAALVGAALSAMGKRVGVLSSPHVTSITERIRLSPHLQPVADDDLAIALETALLYKVPGASWFDVMVASSLQALCTAHCQWAVVECGLGGRLDSTNVLNAKLCALTTVELEHTEVLGDTVEKIATEKAAIASNNGILVISKSAVPIAARRAAIRVARNRGARKVILAPDLRLKNMLSFSPSNLGTAWILLALILKSKKRSLHLLRKPQVLKTAQNALPGRQQWLGPRLLLDVAHTPESVRTLASSLRGRKVVALISLAPDKDVERFVLAVKTHIAPILTIVIPLQCNDQKAERQAHLLQGAFHCGTSVLLLQDLEAGLTAAAKFAIAEDSEKNFSPLHSTVVAVFGSFALTSQVLNGNILDHNIIKRLNTS